MIASINFTPYILSKSNNNFYGISGFLEAKTKLLPPSQPPQAAPSPRLSSYFSPRTNSTLPEHRRMVEGDTSTNNKIISDVKNSAVFNGSKDLQLKPSIDPEKGVSDKADFEGAIEHTGYGLFHYMLLAVCGLVSTAEEMDVISMSFILPSAECDLDLTTQNKGWLNSIIFIGMMAGAYAWGSVADALGRKKVLIVISFMNALCIVASSFSQSYEMFMLFRFLNGAA